MSFSPPAGAVPSTRSAVRQPVAVSKARLSSYASLARAAAVPIVVPAVVPTTLLVANADATIYSQTTTLRIGFGGAATYSSPAYLPILGAGGAAIGQLSLWSSATSVSTAGGTLAQNFAVIQGTNFAWRTVTQQGTNTATWYGGIPVGANATWNNVGRNPSQFPGNAVFGTGAIADVNFGISGATANAVDFDPQRVGNSGATWYLLFKHTDGSSNETYGWLSFQAFVNGGGNPTAQSYIVITGWGYDDSGNTLGAGVTAAAVPGGAGLASLAFGAAGLRGRRRGRN